MSNEPSKELLRIGDIKRWIPGVTEYQIEKQIQAGNLTERRLPGKAGHRFFLKDNVRAVFLESATA